MLAIHVTHKNKIENVLQKGLVCKKYSEHPIASKNCSVFFYPLNGADNDIKYTPQNARLKGEDVNDTVYIAADIGNGIVGDMEYESDYRKYMSNTMDYKKYRETCHFRHKFVEPEVISKGNIPKEKILGYLNYTEMKNVYDKCYNRNEKIHNCDCIEKEIKKHIK